MSRELKLHQISSDKEKREHLKEIYAQHSWNMRAYMTLRFRHFATFTIVQGGLIALAYRAPNLELFRAEILGLGVLMVKLFWLLDYRTGQFLRSYINSLSKY